MAQLIYIVGASGVGKDSLMHYARQRLNGSEPILFAHRYITRPVAGASEKIWIEPGRFMAAAARSIAESGHGQPRPSQPRANVPSQRALLKHKELYQPSRNGRRVVQR